MAAKKHTIVEGTAEIPWTKPEEVVIDLSADTLPNFRFEDSGFSAGFGDGSVRFLARTTDLNTLKAMFTKGGAEVIQP